VRRKSLKNVGGALLLSFTVLSACSSNGDSAVSSDTVAQDGTDTSDDTVAGAASPTAPPGSEPELNDMTLDEFERINVHDLLEDDGGSEEWRRNVDRETAEGIGAGTCKIADASSSRMELRESVRALVERELAASLSPELQDDMIFLVINYGRHMCYDKIDGLPW
jgi:hypothetical protein